MWRLRRLHVLGAGLLLSGSCVGRSNPGGAGSAGPPRLIDARFVDASTLRLRFSEPVTPQDSVDPGQFRLSVAASYSYGYYGTSYTETYYIDAGYWAGATLECGEYCSYYDPTDCYEYCYPTYGTPTTVRTVGITANGSDTIDLSLSPGVDPAVCEIIDHFQDQGYFGDMDLFIHFSDAGGQIQDRDGNALAPIAGHWALHDDPIDYRSGDFPNMDPFLPIPCPG